MKEPDLLPLEEEDTEPFSGSADEDRQMILTAGSDASGQRLDRFLAEKLIEEGITRSRVQQLLDQGMITVGGLPKKRSQKLKGGEEIRILLPEPEEAEILPEDIPLDILYEDRDVLLVNKPKGMVVHPAAGHTSGTLVNALMFHCRGSLSGINGVLRPGIVHRIDRDTTGVLIVCKNDAAHHSIAAQLKEHSITRRYRALVHGVIKDDAGTVDSPMGRDPKDRKRMKCGLPDGKRAVTHYRVLRRYRNATYVECVLETGRTHQIRVHMASIGHPLLGDPVYGNSREYRSLDGQALHAMVLGFIHPSTGAYMEFTAPLPESFQALLKKLEPQAL